MNIAPVPIAWEKPELSLLPQMPKFSGMIWSVAIVWLAGFFLMGSAVTAGAGCTARVVHTPSPEAGSTTQEPTSPPITEEEPPLCSKRERVVWDGGQLSNPLPCKPGYDSSHDWGDPQPFRRSK